MCVCNDCSDLGFYFCRVLIMVDDKLSYWIVPPGGSRRLSKCQQAILNDN